MKRTLAHCTYFALLFVTAFGGIADASDQSKLIDTVAAARAAYNARQFDVAEQKYAEAVKLAGSSTPAKARIALLSNLGAAYRENHKYVEAEDTFKKALAISDAAHLNYDSATKLLMQQYAMLLRKVKRDSEADAMEIRAAAGIVATNDASKNNATQTKTRTTPQLDFTSSTKDRKQIKLALDVQRDFKDVTLDELKTRVSRDPSNWRLVAQVGAKYLDQERYSEAAEEFKKALRDANDATPEQKTQLRFFLGQSYYQAQEPEPALEAFRQLCADNPDDSRFLRYVAACYDALGDMSSELSALELFLQRWPNDEQASAVSQNVQRLRRDVSTTTQQAQVTDNQPSADEVRKSFISAHMPLKVFVNQRDDDRITFSDSNDAQVTENTPGAIIQRSMDLWTQATQGRVTFQFCNSAEEADIVCNFTDEPNGLEAASALGLTSHRTSGGRHIADIRLLTVSPSSTDTLPRSEFAAATLHEFGHALGLEHSNKVSDVMYRAVHAKPLVNLSDNDRDRVCKLYTYNH